MKHECGGNVDVLSITRKSDNSVQVILVCDTCGETDTSIRYLYDDENKEGVIEQLDKLMDEYIKTLNVR